MSVPTYRRNESKTEYLNMLYELNVNLGKIIMNKPKKYRENYGDHIIKTALEALKYAQTANSIFTDKNTSQTDIELRRNLLIKAKGCVENISTVAFIFLELCLTQDGEKEDKIRKQEQYIGSLCYDISKMISGVMKSDKRLHSESPNSGNSNNFCNVNNNGNANNNNANNANGVAPFGYTSKSGE